MLSPQQKARIRPLLRSIAGGGNVLPLAAARRLAEQEGHCLRAVEDLALEEGILPQRYERNIGTLGLDGQRRLLAASALVVGAGGLGGYVLESLARLGVGRIAAVDNDRFSETDLNRQLLCDTGNLGLPKVQVATERIARVNPAVEFQAYETP
ncbi:MAG TPA: ThiF family adenylyltransferase, partial [Phycisphaerae bacterium]|nr:ThiF family adenylyltransferase [Phycisphaerae bacterium]